MAQSDSFKDVKQPSPQIMLDLLTAVDEENAVTQRRLASELGIAVGLVNGYLKRCINKGLIKVQQVPRRRYVYYLTPKGFAEKSRLTASYLRHSFDFFRQARGACETALGEAVAKGWTSIVFVGRGDLAEIAMVCAMRYPIRVVAVVDSANDANDTTYLGLPVFSDMESLPKTPSGALVTDIEGAQLAYDTTVNEIGVDRVLVPDLLAGAITGIAVKESGP